MSATPASTTRSGLRLDRAVRLVWRTAPGWTLANVALLLAQGLLPLAGLYALKQVVDAVTVAISHQPSPVGLQSQVSDSVLSPESSVLAWIAVAAAIGLATALSRSLAEMTSEAQALVVTDAVADVLHAQSVAVDLEYYDDASYHDTLHRAQLEAPHRPARVVNGLLQVGQSALLLAGIGGLLLAFNWIIALALCAVAIPGGLVRLLFSRRLYDLGQRQAEGERRAWYYHWLMTSAEHAKELRLLGIGALLRGRYRDLRRDLRGGRLSVSRRRAGGDFAAQAGATLGIFGTFGYAAVRASEGAISLGDLVMYYQAFQTGLGALQGLLRGLAGLYEDNLFLENFYRFLDLKPRVGVPARPMPVPARFDLRFEGVTFWYPDGEKEFTDERGLARIGRMHGNDGSNGTGERENAEVRGRPVLEGIDLRVGSGEVVALVGQNGAGKTTLVKLLCRLYDPQEGRITVGRGDAERESRRVGETEGEALLEPPAAAPSSHPQSPRIDLRDLDPTQWRRRIGVVFQDFARYEMTALENIALGDATAPADSNRAAEAARLSGADRAIDRLPDGYRNLLGRIFERSKELSEGEWQKVALARAFYRQSPLVVLDEPTSSLDPLAEAELFAHFRDLLDGRSAIIISHRFSTVQMADRIYVLEGGRIVEQGTHQELLRLGARYSTLYRAQADAYQDSNHEHKKCGDSGDTPDPARC